MAKRRNKPRFDKPNQKGRNDKSGRFVMLPFRILESAAYASLDLPARLLLQELVMLYNGDNNGMLYLSAKDAAARLGQSNKRAALRAFDDLQDCGFITLAKDAHFAVKAADTSRARCWRLTWHAWPECPVTLKRGPTNEWQQYTPLGGTASSKRADKRLRALASYRKSMSVGKFAGTNLTPMEANMPNYHAGAGTNMTPANDENNANPPFLIGTNMTPYIDTTRGSVCLGWWSTPEQAQITGHILLLHIMTQNWLNRGAGKSLRADDRLPALNTHTELVSQQEIHNGR